MSETTFDLTIGTRTAEEGAPAAVVVSIAQGSFHFCTALNAESARSWRDGLDLCIVELEALTAGETPETLPQRPPFDADEFAKFCADPDRREMVRHLLDRLDEEE